jgi:hypothetical protein
MKLSVTQADLTFLGRDLARPECVVATASGDVFASDRRGGIARVHEQGPPELILGRGVEQFLPNGFALLQGRSFMIANLGPSGGVWRMLPDGELVPELLEVDGMSLPPTNFANAEHATGALRLWVSVSTRKVPREQAMRSDVAAPASSPTDLVSPTRTSSILPAVGSTSTRPWREGSAASP